MSLIKVGVLRGGPSSEYDISLKTGKHILSMLGAEPLSKAYKGVDIFIDKHGVWHVDGLPLTPEAALRRVDVIFNALKGEFGEDGKLQRILESFSMPFVGTGAYGSALALNKGMAKEHFRQQGIKTPYHKELDLGLSDDLDPVARDLFRSFPMPVVVKPKGHGSSLGVSFASDFKELMEALDHARGFSNEVLVEEYLTGKEIISGFIDDFRGQDLYHLFPVEVKPHDVDLFGKEASSPAKLADPAADRRSEKVGIDDLSEEERALAAADPLPKKKRFSIFNWVAKHAGRYDHQSPASLTEGEKKVVEEAMRKVRDTLGLRHFATADFIIHPRRGVYMLEVNTQPGLHEHSPIYKSLDAAGVRHHEFLDHLLKLALRRGK